MLEQKVKEIMTKEDMKREKMTIDEHFIPCTYLSEFSSKRNDEDSRKSPIFYYNCEKRISSVFNGVLIKSLSCVKEKYLYELLMDNENEVLYPNIIEKLLGKTETDYHKYVQKLDMKICVDNYKTRCFLNHDEKEFWRRWMFHWFFRRPSVFKDLESYVPKDEDDVYGIGLGGYLSGLCELGFDDQFITTFFDTKWPQIWGLNSFCIFYDEYANIITSDNPMCYECENGKINFILLPISNKFLLIMWSDKRGHFNVLRPMTTDVREYTFKIIVMHAIKMIFLSQPIDKYHKKIANDILNLRDKSLKDKSYIRDLITML